MIKYVLIGLLLTLHLIGKSQQPSNKTSKKIALVIGVANYQHAGALKNPINDADDMASTLTKLGFQVYKITDPTLKDITTGIDTFGKNMVTADVCLFYYSGHGAEYNGENFLFPKDANPNVPSDLMYDAYPIGKLIGKIDFAKAKTSIIVLDACRNNPFTKAWKKGINVHEGLTNIDAPNGTFIGFAASPGKTASDGARRNGTYTEAILKFVETKNISIDQLFNKVNKEVRIQSAGKQIPFKNSSLEDDYYFVNDYTQPTEKETTSNLSKFQYPAAPFNRPEFPLPKVIKGYTNGSMNSYALVSINKRKFSQEEFIELYIDLVNENIWDKTTPLYVELNKRIRPTSAMQVWKEEFKQSQLKTKIRFTSSFEPGNYELIVGYYLINELNNEFPTFYSKRFTITIE